MNAIIGYLKNKNVHTPQIALGRFLLAFAMLLYVSFNGLDVVANHNYTLMRGHTIRHSAHASVPFKQADLFMIMNPSSARIVVMIILLVVMTGFYPKITGILHFWACFSVHNYFMILNGGDEIALVLSSLLLPVCLTDPRRNQWARHTTGPSRRNIVAYLALVAIQAQAAYIYFCAGYEKFFSKKWLDGTAVYYYTSHHNLGAPSWLRTINEYITLTPLVKALSWGVLGFELLLAACFFLPPRLKKRFIIPGIIFHLLIVFNFGLITFFFSISGMLILYLDEQDSVTGWFRKKLARSA